MFEKISEEEYKEITDNMFEKIVEDFQTEKNEDGFHKYIVILQGDRFCTYMTDEELKQTIGLVLDIIEELKNIYNSGLNTDKLTKIKNKNKAQEDSSLYTIYLYNDIKTDKLDELANQMNEVRRVGGAYAIFLAKPLFMSAIYATFELFIDERYDDEMKYLRCCYFLIRAAMKMHSDEINEDNEKKDI